MNRKRTFKKFKFNAEQRRTLPAKLWVTNPVLKCILLWEFCLIYSALGSQGTNTFMQRDKEARYSLFSMNKFHYLNVPRVGIFLVYNDFECAFKCLQHPSCFSVNLATKGKLWCELLSSDKYSDPKEFRQDKSWHYFYIVNTSTENHCKNKDPYQNDGTHTANCSLYPAAFVGLRNSTDIDECVEGSHNCSPNAFCNKTKESHNCTCKPGYIGNGRECKGVTSCNEIHENGIADISSVVTLLVDSKPVSVLCHMGDFGCGDGGWTPVLKIDGRKATFRYSSPYWSDYEEFNQVGGKTGFDEQESKLPTYWNTSFTKICLGMKIEQQLRFTVINKEGDSLHSLIADGEFRAIPLGRQTWKSLIGSRASLQLNCNKEGFNAGGDTARYSKARIGIVGNFENECNSCNSRIGFGSEGRPDDSNTCGNEANPRGPDNGEKHIKAMGYIFVQ